MPTSAALFAAPLSPRVPATGETTARRGRAHAETDDFRVPAAAASRQPLATHASARQQWSCERRRPLLL
ncbi:hypothetical protein E2562_036057 [Oryza meyeriana var. granulata]|uniref:Uncharacterized protein n=1 Tax=Oryza meyeriana var. granulata TaxID=110450 RepID=A0A6G1EWU2_9ORYZ|nr:hypothetical protein E2562_016377 [Oryza meyeriana var. granulata]KAF0935818.1 hypothetical protein E2562_036057 [Oryza meyeriana var. granulata]